MNLIIKSMSVEEKLIAQISALSLGYLNAEKALEDINKLICCYKLLKDASII